MVTSRAEHALTASIQLMASEQLNGQFSVVVGVLHDWAAADLFPEEMRHVSGAALRRRATFKAGRACAQAALANLGATPAAIPAKRSGAPSWPKGFTGSISHTDDFVAAVIACTPPAHAVGIDVESNEPLDNGEMVRLICHDEELLMENDAAHLDNLIRRKTIFVVKEAICKTYATLNDSYLDFHDVRVYLDVGRGTFVASVFDLKGVAASQEFTGHFASVGQLLVAFCSLSNSEPVLISQGIFMQVESETSLASLVIENLF